MIICTLLHGRESVIGNFTVVTQFYCLTKKRRPASVNTHTVLGQGIARYKKANRNTSYTAESIKHANMPKLTNGPT